MWVKGTMAGGATVTINTDNITYIRESADGDRCAVHFDNNHSVLVEGSTDDLLGIQGGWTLVEVSFGKIME